MQQQAIFSPPHLFKTFVKPFANVCSFLTCYEEKAVRKEGVSNQVKVVDHQAVAATMEATMEVTIPQALPFRLMGHRISLITLISLGIIRYHYYLK